MNDASELISTLRAAVEDQVPQAVALRRAIHQHPELAGAERETADRIVSALAPLGLEITTSVGGHGVVARLRGGLSGPHVAYRAELDAVPTDEAVDLPFRSVAVLDRVLGYEHVTQYRASSPFNGEDFAVFLQRAPGVMLLLGVADYAQGRLGIPHQPDFIADEAAIEVAIIASTAVILSRIGVDV